MDGCISSSKLIQSKLNFATSNKHYISPKHYDQSSLCKENHHDCFTLSQFADEYSSWHSSTDLELVSFTRSILYYIYLKSELKIIDIQKFEMTSYSSNASIVMCDESSRFTWIASFII